MVRTTMEIDKLTLENLKAVGKKNQTYDEIIKQRISCNTNGCEDTGNIKINMKHGKVGSLTLFVCLSCLGKLQNEH